MSAAAKHFFRYLHNARALRKNPLVRSFFENPEIGGFRGARERAVLERIHARVRQAADECRDADLDAGNDERALRHHAIVLLECLERRPMKEVAATLGLSLGYCYRERSAICLRIARYFAEPENVALIKYLPKLDEFSMALDRTRQRATLGDADGAFRACDELVRSVSSPEQRVEALRTTANIALELGAPARAQAAYAVAARIAEDRTVSLPSKEVIRASLDLMGHKLAFSRAASDVPLTNVQSAASRLAAIREAVPYAQDLYVESLYDLAVALATAGDAQRAYDCVASAEAKLGLLRPGSSRLRTRIMILVWRLRNHLLTNASVWCPSHQRASGLTSAFELAYAAGLYCEAAAALVALAEARAYAGLDDETLRLGNLALLIANQHPSEHIRTQIQLTVAAPLASTRHWRRAFSLIPDANRLAGCDADHRGLVSFLRANEAFLHGDFNDAWNLAHAGNQRGDYAALTLQRRLIAAEAAHELERRRDACTLVEAALPVAERIGAPALRDALSVAAKVTGELRYQRQANEVSQLLTAESPITPLEPDVIASHLPERRRV